MARDNIFDLYIDYLLTSLGQVTATGLSYLTGGLISHDKITRLLSNSEYGPQDLWKFVKPTVRMIESETDGIIAFDDTIIEKEYTDENEIVCWHFDHSKQRNVKGINLLTGLYYTNGISIPITYQIVQKTEKYIDKKDGKEKRKSPVSKNEMMRNLSLQIMKNQIKFKYFLTDSWFSASDNMVFFKQEIGKDFIMAVKSNRTVALSVEDKKSKRYIPIDSIKLENDSTLQVYLEGVKFPVILGRKIFTNGDGSQGILYLMTSDLELSYNELFSNYQKRWKIEEYHKSLKQNAGVGKSPTQTMRTQSNHIFASICAFSKMEKLAVSKNTNQFALKKFVSLNAQRQAIKIFSEMCHRLKNFTFPKIATA
jgi:hypothetical protein